MRAHESLALKPVERCVDRAGRYATPGSLNDFVAHRKSETRCFVAHHGEQYKQFEFAKSGGRHAL